MHWIQHLGNGLKRVNHAAVAIGSLIYSFGGYCSEEDSPELMDVCVFNTDSLNWYQLRYSRTGDIPPSLFGHSAVVYKNKVYIWGGISSHHQNQVSEKLYCFDVASLTWSVIEGTGHVPKATDGHSACLIGNSMYVFGGFESISEVLVNMLYRIDLDTFNWQRLWTKGNPPSPRDFHTASVIGRRMYIFGGRSYIDDAAPTDEIYYNEIMYIDVDSLTWVKPFIITDEPRGRRSHSAAVYNGEIYIIGGCCPDYNTDVLHLNDVYKFNAESNLWTKLNIKGRGPNPRRRHCSVVIGDRLFLFGGSSPKENWLYGSMMVLSSRLKEENDLFIMDLCPTLRRLCQLKVIEYGLENHFIPAKLKDELQCLKKSEAPIYNTPQQIVL